MEGLRGWPAGEGERIKGTAGTDRAKAGQGEGELGEAWPGGDEHKAGAEERRRGRGRRG